MSSSRQPTKKSLPKKKVSTHKSKSKKKTQKSSQNPVRPISPVPSLSEKDLQEMEHARSQFNNSFKDQLSAKQQRLEKIKRSRKESLSISADQLFEKHNIFCDKVSGIVKDITLLLRQAAELDRIMKHSDLRSYNINRRLHFDSLVRDLKVASTRLGGVSVNSRTLNKVHHNLISEDIHSKQPAFE